jgi:RloB-like protein
MPRLSNSFRRIEPRYKPQPRVLVICEDTKSGKTYLQDACRQFRTTASIIHCGRTDPLGIVQEAIARHKGFDKTYCAIDRDNHQNFDAAMIEARKYPAITTIVSYPCFEFWLLLNFEYSRRPYTAVGSSSAADRVIAELRTKPGMQGYAKGADRDVFAALYPHGYEKGLVHAARALLNARETDELNPSTRVHELLEYLKSLSAPQLA